MSMNLHCNHLELPQIPTYASYLVYSNNDGGWRGVAYRLEQYWRMKSQQDCNAQPLTHGKHQVLRNYDDRIWTLKWMCDQRELEFSVW